MAPRNAVDDDCSCSLGSSQVNVSRMMQVFYLDVTELDWDVAYIYASVSCFYAYVASLSSWCLHMFAMATHVFSSFFVFCKCLRRMLQVFQLFQTYVVSVLSGCCKNRSDVAMRVRSGGGVSGPCARSGCAGIVQVAWASRGRTKCRLGPRACWLERGKRSVFGSGRLLGHPSASTAIKISDLSRSEKMVFNRWWDKMPGFVG
jgi:hypothetical protein